MKKEYWIYSQMNKLSVMSQEFESDSEEIGCTRSGKRYKVHFRSSLFEDSSGSTREQIQSNRERTTGGIPYHPYTP